MLHRPSGFISEFFIPLVGVAPDLRQTHGRVKVVEDDERHAQMTDDAPRQATVVLRVHRQVLGFPQLEAADDPHREIQQQQ